MVRQESKPARLLGFFPQMNPQIPEKMQGDLWNLQLASDTKIKSSRNLCRGGRQLGLGVKVKNVGLVGQTIRGLAEKELSGYALYRSSCCLGQVTVLPCSICGTGEPPCQPGTGRHQGHGSAWAGQLRSAFSLPHQPIYPVNVATKEELQQLCSSFQNFD